MGESVPTDRRYSRDHMWARLEGGLIRIGITRTAEQALGEIVFLDLPREGGAVRGGEALGWLESGKSIADVCSPLSGTIVRSNGLLAAQPHAINSDPYGAGWLCELQPAQPGELEQLLDARGYEAWVGAGT